MPGLTTNDADTSSSVCPSGAAFATASVPTMPLAPVRFSTTNGCPVCAASCWPTRRAMVSGAPAPKGTITRTARLGYWPQALHAQARASAVAAARARTLVSFFRIHDLAADHRQHRLDVLDLGRRDGEVVAVEHQHVGVLSGLDRADVAFLEDEMRVVARVRDERLGAAHALAVDPAPADHAPGPREGKRVERVGRRHGRRVRP